jgi:hypothetical protein
VITLIWVLPSIRINQTLSFLSDPTESNASFEMSHFLFLSAVPCFQSKLRNAGTPVAAGYSDSAMDGLSEADRHPPVGLAHSLSWDCPAREAHF